MGARSPKVGAVGGGAGTDSGGACLIIVQRPGVDRGALAADNSNVRVAARPFWFPGTIGLSQTHRTRRARAIAKCNSTSRRGQKGSPGNKRSRRPCRGER